MLIVKKIYQGNFYKKKRNSLRYKILVYEELHCTKKSIKYFIGYFDNDAIGPRCVKFPQMIGYVKCFDSSKIMSSKVSDKKTIKKVHQNMGKSQKSNQ